MSFTFVANHYEDKAVEAAVKVAGKIDHSDKKYNDAYNGYIDSLSKEKVWLGSYTLQDVREKQLGLGLDLKGGMTATLELSVPDILVELSDKNETEKFKNAIEASGNLSSVKRWLRLRKILQCQTMRLKTSSRLK